MTENKSILSSLDSMCSFSSATLANGSTFPVQDIGLANAISSLSLSLSSILYILNFSFSLLSASKITGALNYLVCEFQKLRTKMIGTRHEKDGLYYLDMYPNQWHHYRLCHLSLSVLKILISKSSQTEPSECKSCQLEKYHQIFYSNRVNKRVNHPFDLVHSDVWDP